MITWHWDSAARGHALGGIVASPDRAVARYLIGQRMRAAGALSALAREVERDDWGRQEATGAAMIARAADFDMNVIRWRDVTDPAQGAIRDAKD